MTILLCVTWVFLFWFVQDSKIRQSLLTTRVSEPSLLCPDGKNYKISYCSTSIWSFSKSTRLSHSLEHGRSCRVCVLHPPFGNPQHHKVRDEGLRARVVSTDAAQPGGSIFHSGCHGWNLPRHRHSLRLGLIALLEWTPQNPP